MRSDDLWVRVVRVGGHQTQRPTSDQGAETQTSSSLADARQLERRLAIVVVSVLQPFCSPSHTASPNCPIASQAHLLSRPSVRSQAASLGVPIPSPLPPPSPNSYSTNPPSLSILPHCYEHYHCTSQCIRSYYCDPGTPSPAKTTHERPPLVQQSRKHPYGHQHSPASSPYGPATNVYHRSYSHRPPQGRADKML